MNDVDSASCQGTIVCIWPGIEIVTTPPNEQMHCDELFSAGAGPDITVGDPGTQGAAVIGVHGIGTSTPSAAAVADATAGFARLMHMPNGTMLTNGLLSKMFAIGMLDTMILFTGSTFSVLGAAPNEHIVTAPVLTAIPMGGRLVQS